MCGEFIVYIQIQRSGNRVIPKAGAAARCKKCYGQNSPSPLLLPISSLSSLSFFPSPPLKSRHPYWRYGVWGALKLPPAGPGGALPPNEFWCILSQKCRPGSSGLDGVFRRGQYMIIMLVTDWLLAYTHRLSQYYFSNVYMTFHSC